MLLSYTIQEYLFDYINTHKITLLYILGIWGFEAKWNYSV